MKIKVKIKKEVSNHLKEGLQADVIKRTAFIFSATLSFLFTF